MADLSDDSQSILPMPLPSPVESKKKKRGRPKNIKIKAAGLLAYLDALPESSLIRQNLTPDSRLVIERYVAELTYLEGTIRHLKDDIFAFGEIEVFVQGKQRLRRQNPSMPLYLSSLRAYARLLEKINELIRDVDVF